MPPPPPPEQGEDAQGSANVGGSNVAAKKPWRKPTVTVIWDELADVGSAPNPSGPGAESPTYQQIS